MKAIIRKKKDLNDMERPLEYTVHSQCFNQIALEIKKSCSFRTKNLYLC